MTTGWPPIRPHPDHKPLVSGLGASAAKADETEGFEFMRKPCKDQNAILGMEDDIGEELKASDEGEDAVKVASLPTPFQQTLSQFTDHSVTRFSYQSWCP